MRNLDTARLVRLAVAGAIAGFIVFLVVNPSAQREEARIRYHVFGGAERLAERAADALVTVALYGMAIGSIIGGMLALADEFGSVLKRLAMKLGLAVGVGVAVGAITGGLAQLIFSVVLQGGLLFLLPARVAAWAVMGAGAGAGIGVALGSTSRAFACIIGGLVGGFVGGLLFDVIGAFVYTGTASRLFGFTVLGATIGAAVCYVEDLAKQSWITVLSGPKEGRSFILTKPVTTIGRDELADIPLFGDPAVAKQHAVLHLTRPLVTLQSAGPPVMVNGVHTLSTQLKDSDIIQLGRIALRFHQKATQNLSGRFQAAAQASYQHSPSCAPQPTVAQPAMAPATGALELTAVAGPHTGLRFQFGAGSIKIGREADCAILLAGDTTVSRRHAEIGWDGRAWWIRDLGSTNGTYINGARVSQQMFGLGDQIGVGQTVLRVEGI